MIDFHCHLDLYQNSQVLLPIVVKRNIFTLVVTTSPRAWQMTSQIFAGYDNLKVAVGLHPEIVANKANERSLLLSSIPKATFVGEVGMDGSFKYQDTMSIQESIFTETLIECQKAGGKIISIHSRNAVSRVLSLIEKYNRDSIPVLHWFSGTLKEANYAVDLGCWFSVGPAMASGSKGRALLKVLPLNKILPETDGPFTTYRFQPIMPWDAINIADTLAEIWGITKETVYVQLQHNLKTLLDVNQNNSK